MKMLSRSKRKQINQVLLGLGIGLGIVAGVWIWQNNRPQIVVVEQPAPAPAPSLLAETEVASPAPSPMESFCRAMATDLVKTAGYPVHGSKPTENQVAAAASGFCIVGGPKTPAGALSWKLKAAKPGYATLFLETVEISPAAFDAFAVEWQKSAVHLTPADYQAAVACIDQARQQLERPRDEFGSLELRSSGKGAEFAFEFKGSISDAQSRLLLTTLAK